MNSKIIAHRGLRNTYPENTLIAIEEALKLDLAGIEFDLELTADRDLVVLHQETLVATNGVLQLTTRESKRAWVNQMLAKELINIDAGSWFGSKFSNYKIPLFKEVRRAPWGGKTAMVEIKDPFFWDNPDGEFENKIVQAVERQIVDWHEAEVILISFNEIILQKMRILKPEASLGLNVWFDSVADINDLIDFSKSLRIGLMQFPDQMICDNPDIVRQVHLAGLSVGSYSVSPTYNDPSFKDWTFSVYQPTLLSLLKLEVDYIITDFASESLTYIKNDLRHN